MTKAMTNEARDELVRELLTNLSSIDIFDVNLRDSPQAYESVYRLIDRIASYGGWVSVADRLPPKSGKYWTYCPTCHFKQQQSEWVAEVQAWWHEWERKKRSEIQPRTWITHWRELPLPPTGA